MGAVHVLVNDTMQQKYTYKLEEPVGKYFDKTFKPQLTPMRMLELGVFGGKYLTDCQAEFPEEWFEHAKISKQGYDVDKNYFRVEASQPLSLWRSKGWIYEADPRGWFQWYCRYYMGRRCEDDERQIKRWRYMGRYLGQIQKQCKMGDHLCETRQRQALLQWAYDTRFI